MNTNVLKKLVETLLVILIIVLGVLIINNYFNDSSNINTQKLLIPDLLLSEVTGINFKHNGKTVLIKKTDSTWYVSNYLASESAVEIAISKLLAITISSTVSTDSINNEKYNVTNEESKVDIITDSKLVTIFFGSSNEVNFARLDNSSVTYSIEDDISSIFDKDENFFRNKVVTLFNPDSIRQFKINNNQYEFLSGNWYKDSVLKDQNKVVALLLKLSSIEATDFATQADVNNITNVNNDLNILIQVESKTIKFDVLNYNNKVYIKYNDEVFIVDSKLLQDITDLNTSI